MRNKEIVKYERFARPEINVTKAIIMVCLTIVLAYVVLAVLIHYNVAFGWLIAEPFIFIGGMIFIHLRCIAIFLVRVYQRFAPMEVRQACLCNPTCSEYMARALQKYGFFKGVYKGWCRLLRCGSTNEIHDDEP